MPSTLLTSETDEALLHEEILHHPDVKEVQDPEIDSRLRELASLMKSAYDWFSTGATLSPHKRCFACDGPTDTEINLLGEEHREPVRTILTCRQCFHDAVTGKSRSERSS
jgi:hypothetical protein